MPGLWVYGDHSVEATPSGTRATLRLSYEGALARLLGRLTRGITNRYLDMEANGLKRRSEENGMSEAALSVLSVRFEPGLGVAERGGHRRR